jgi:hypothetical protein
MDIADASELEIENTRVDQILKNSSSSIPNGGLVPMGICHNERCEAEIAPKKLFCNGDCATEHHKTTHRLKR